MTFRMLISFAGRMERLILQATDIHSAMDRVRNNASDPAILVSYEVIA